MHGTEREREDLRGGLERINREWHQGGGTLALRAI